MLNLDSDNIVHLTHTDLDGISCRVLISKLCDNAFRNYHPIHADYSDISDKFIIGLFADIASGIYGDNVSVIITDLNFTVSQSKLIDECINNTEHLNELSLYDHHISGSESASKFPEWYYLDSSRSATLIVFDKIVQPTELLNPNEKLSLSIYSMFVNAYDIYLRDSHIEFQIGHFINACLQDKLLDIPNQFHHEKYEYASLFMNEIVNNDITSLYYLYNSYIDGTKIGTFALDSLLEKTVSTFKRKFLVANNIEHISSYQGMAMYLESKFDITKFPIILCNNYKLLIAWDLPSHQLKPVFDIQMYEQNKYDAYITINTHRGTAGVYSKNGTLDVSKIATYFGGGGHVHAAGCMCAILQVPNLDDISKHNYFIDLLSHIEY